jgi:hypothetical protein
MKRGQHFATVNYSEEERTETGGMLPTQQMRGRERWGEKRRTTCKKLWSK